MIQLKNCSLRQGKKLLFDNVSLNINPGEHVGLIGPNGSGKSSFFSLLQKQIILDQGSCEIPKNWKISCFTQEIKSINQIAIEYVLDGDENLRKIEKNIEQARMKNDGQALANAFIEYDDANGYSARSRAEILLLGLGFSQNTFNEPIKNFSGGWRVRLNLARALIAPADLLLLDEPTNHLDINTIIWLEDWLSIFPKTFIVISHDQEFLDAVTNTTLFISSHKIHRYASSYSEFRNLRSQELALQRHEYVKQEKQTKHLESFINRFQAKSTKAKQVQSRIKTLSKMEKIDPLIKETLFNFEFVSAEKTPNPLIVLDKVDCGYQTISGKNCIIEKASLSLVPGARIGLLGPNGEGKSTLIKTLAKVVPPLNGKFLPSKGLKIGYFAQHQVDVLKEEQTPLSVMMQIAPKKNEETLRSFLGKFNFQKDSSLTPIKMLSGGEKARLALAIIIWGKPNLLLLDEPTNHLDIETRDALTRALAQFEGTLIVVSHDRHLLRATTNTFLYIENKKLNEFDGDLDDYRQKLLENSKKEKYDTNNGKIKPDFQLAKKPKDIKKFLIKIEKKLADLEEEKKRIEQFLSNPLHYSLEHKETLAQNNTQLQLLIKEQEKLEDIWLNLLG